MSEDLTPVQNLPNIGDVLAKELAAAGIITLADLRRTGSAGAIYKIRGISGRGCCNMLYALEGALKNIRWHSLTKDEKDTVKNELERLIQNAKI